MSMMSLGILLLDQALKLKILRHQVTTWCKKRETFYNYSTFFFELNFIVCSTPEGLTPSQRRDHKEKERKRLRQLEYIYSSIV